MSVEDEIIQAEHDRRKAIESYDFEALERLTADPYQYAHVTGFFEDRAQFFDRMRNEKAKIISTSAHDLHVQVGPGYAIMRGVSRIEMDPAYKLPVFETYFQTIWVPGGDGWQAASYAGTPMKGKSYG